MSAADIFTAALGQGHRTARYFLCIEGHPYAFGNFAAGSEWFHPVNPAEQPYLDPEQRFEGVLPWLKRDRDGNPIAPQLEPARVDMHEGRVELGALRVAIADMDGSLAALAAVRRADDWLRLTTAVEPGDATWDTSGDASNWPESGTAFCGEEAFHFTRSGNTLTSTLRGAYRTTARQHHAGEVAIARSFDRKGAIVTPYSRKLAGRRAWLYLGLDAANVNTCVVIWTGVVVSYGWEDASQVLVLSCNDAQAHLKRPIFTSIGDGFYEPMRANTPALKPLSQLPSPVGCLWVDGLPVKTDVKNKSTHYALINDSIWALERDQAHDNGWASRCFRIRGAGLLGPSIKGLPQSNNPVPVRPVVLVCPRGPSGDALDAVPFTAGAHPLEVLLQVLLSTGTGTNGEFDTLPDGLGLDPEEVDVAGIKVLIRETPGLQISLLVTDEVDDAREWLVRECLKPAGFYLRPVFPGRIGVGYVAPITQDQVAGATTIGLRDIAVDSEGRPTKLEGPTSDSDQIVTAIKWADSPIIRDGKLELAEPITIRIVDDIETADLGTDFRKIEVKASGLHGRSSSGFSVIGTKGTDLATTRLAALQARFGAPSNVLAVECWLEKATLNPGDLVSVTLPHFPSIKSATRGLSGDIFEVQQVGIDLARGVVTLELSQTGLDAQIARYLAPALDVAGWNAGTQTLTVAQNGFTDVGGSYSDVDAFSVGDVVRIYSGDMGTRSGAVVIQSIPSSTSVVLAGVPTGLTPASGCVVMPADYTECAPGQRSRFAFRANDNEVLGSGDPAHIFG